MVKKHKKTEPVILVPQNAQRGCLKNAWEALKSKPAKITYKAAAGLVSVAVAFHTALLNFPQLVTESGEEFVERNKIPPELLTGFDLKNIRVYKDSHVLNAMHAASVETAYAAKNFGWLDDAYKKGFGSLFNGENSNFMQAFPDGQCIVHFGNKKGDIQKYTSNLTGISAEDLELSPQITPEILFYNTVLHEFTHTRRALYNTQEKSFACGTEKEFRDIFYSDNVTSYKINEQNQRDEVIADHETLSRLDKDFPELRKYWTAIRAVGAFSIPEKDGGYRSQDDIHDTAIYTEALRNKKGAPVLPDIEFKQTENLLLYKYAQHEAKKYVIKDETKYIPPVYLTYMGMLDVMDNHYKNKKYLNNNMYASALMFVEGLEFLAPQKAYELRQKRELQNPSLTKSSLVLN